MIRSLSLTNFLSFGGAPTVLPLRPMNLLIGPNASGKSNVIRALRLLSRVPSGFTDAIRAEGTQDWVYKGGKGLSVPRLEVSLDLAVEAAAAEPYEFTFAFDVAEPARPVIAEEVLRRTSDSQVILENRRGVGTALQRVDLPTGSTVDTWKFNQLDPIRPFLEQVRSPPNYPHETAMGDALQKWAFYVDTWLGTFAPGRAPQRTDLPSDRLLEDGSNLAAVLHERGSDKLFRDKLGEAMRALYADYSDFHTRLQPPGIVQLIVKERRSWGVVDIPSTRLSDGTLRVLALFALLADPNPPALVCIEEPEVGLHPDAIGTLAKLLQDAATRTQLVVTTHSDMLVDAFSETPEDVVICERKSGSTTLQRLDREELSTWLREYSLGSLWIRGDLGGTRS
jgi:predicted ATPase